MGKDKYDKVLILMSIDIAYEQSFGVKYVDQSVFDRNLEEVGVSKPDGKLIAKRMESVMDELIKELNE